MNEPLMLMVAGLAGLFLGAIFFGGLWWTIRKGLASLHPARWFFGSLIVRLAVTLAGFYLIGKGDWHRLVGCLLGFIAARLLVSWFLRSSAEKSNIPNGEDRHAS